MTPIVGAREIRGLVPCLEHAILLALVVNVGTKRNLGPETHHRPSCGGLRWQLQAAWTPYPNRRRRRRKAPGKDIREGDPPRARRGKELSTKGHEGVGGESRGMRQGFGQGALCRPQDHSPLEGESARPGRSPRSSRWGSASPSPRDLQGKLTSMHRMHRIFQETASLFS